MKLAAFVADSLKLAKQKHRIDSLRMVTQGIPVVVDNDTLFYFYAKRGGHTRHCPKFCVNGNRIQL